MFTPFFSCIVLFDTGLFYWFTKNEIVSVGEELMHVHASMHVCNFRRVKRNTILFVCCVLLRFVFFFSRRLDDDFCVCQTHNQDLFYSDRQ